MPEVHDWFLTVDERGNRGTTIDRRRDDGRAWSEGNLVTPLVHGASYYPRLLAALHQALRAAGSPALVAAGVTVGAAALLTRGLHLDGLADTVDALGSYRTGDKALEIMKKPDIGPFGVTVVVVTLLIQAAALTEAGAWAIVTAWATGRLAVTVTCRPVNFSSPRAAFLS